MIHGEPHILYVNVTLDHINKYLKNKKIQFK